MLRVTTWNVLHRIHAINWKEAPVASFPDESVRIGEIAARVVGWLASRVDVVALQEVSGDQLAAIRSAGGAHAFEVLAHRYPRLPRLRDGSASPLSDPTEHLVVVTRVPATLRDARTSDRDPGKGFLAVELEGGILVVDTHVSSGDRRGPQLEALGAVGAGAPTIVLGDFNATAEVVGAGLGEGFVLADLSSQPPTRLATWEHPAKTIDHVAVRRGSIMSCVVEDGGGLSDHQPVTAVVTIRTDP